LRRKRVGDMEKTLNVKEIKAKLSLCFERLIMNINESNGRYIMK
jgi:hypothetical protein